MKWKGRDRGMSLASDQNIVVGKEKLWTPANVVTLVRICLVPVFVVALVSPWPEWFGLPQVTAQTKSLIAAGIFILISCTDWLDGYLARSRNEVTDFGKFMDPLADKILVTAALLALIELGSLPSWVVLVILAREFIVSGVRMVAATEGVVIAASWYGKFKTVFQMIAIVLFTIKDSYMVGTVSDAFSDGMWLLSWVIMIIALALTVISMLDYIAKARHLIGFGKKGSQQADAVVDEGDFDKAPDGGADEACSQEYLDSLAMQVIDAARAANKTLGTAESLTGGLIASALTSVAGSSSVVRGGVVSYVDAVKHKVLKVPSAILETQGAVSEETACAMAQGARADLDVDFAISATGIAGPSGAEDGKPVGTVWLGFSGASGTYATRYCFSGDRGEVRSKTVAEALRILLKELDVN